MTRAERDTRLRGLRTSALLSFLRTIAGWLRASRLGLVVMALLVGAGAGFGAVCFRWLIYAFTWLATGHDEFGQQGRIGSLHLPRLGIWFLLIIPVVGGLLYGPLIQRFAKEARGHGVPEVMLAVAENGGRIRPPVTIVKALASGVCIGVGGSVGREGPIVQVGSALASTMGQWVRMSETRLRILVACGAAGGIAATFNAPITGLFFGFEIILREFSLDALFATILSAVTADLVSRAFFGPAPFFAGMPHGLVVTHDYTYLLIALLGIVTGLIGWGFKSLLYKLEDVMDHLWKGRAEWARPAVGGLALGALLLAVPQMYGVGYPVMDQVAAGYYVLWFVVILALAKIAAASLTLSIGGSGGVFAPSLFTGVTVGMAFGIIVHHLFGPVVTNPAIFAVVAMGGVFGAAAQAPLTAIASVVEMTGDFTLILPVMLTAGIASAIAKHLSYGSIYTTKLLRRGIDIERPRPTSVLQTLTVADVMLAFPEAHEQAKFFSPAQRSSSDAISSIEKLKAIAGVEVEAGKPQALFSDETLDQALRQLVLYGQAGLPVLSPDGQHLRGWITRHNVLRAMDERIGSTAVEARRGRLATEFAEPSLGARLDQPRTPLDGYQTVQISIRPESSVLGLKVDDLHLPSGSILVAVSQEGELAAPRTEQILQVGDRLVLLVPATSPDELRS